MYSNIATSSFRLQSTTSPLQFFIWRIWLQNYGGHVDIKDIFGPCLVKKWQQRK